MTYASPAASQPNHRLGFPVALAAIAGFVDAATFLAFAGFFVAQATGSFVVAGSELFGADETYAFRVLAIPVFLFAGILTTAIVRVSSARLAMTLTLGLETVLLIGLAVAGILGDQGVISTAPALFGLAAMGVQSAAVRLLLSAYGSTNVMTTNTTQLSIEIVDSIRARRITSKLLHTGSIMSGFLGGVVLGGLAYRSMGLTGLGFPIVLLAGLALLPFLSPRKQPDAI